MSEYKNHAYEDKVSKYIEDNKIAFTDIDEKVIEAVVEKYLAFDEADEKDESEGSNKTETPDETK